MNCTINWMPGSGMAFSAETGSGHVLVMDGAPDGGGRNLAPRPMETVLAGTGGCTAYDVVLILQRGRQDVRGCQVVVTSERASVDHASLRGCAFLMRIIENWRLDAATASLNDQRLCSIRSCAPRRPNSESASSHTRTPSGSTAASLTK